MENKTGQLTNVVIRASAGTGKTYQLSNRYLRILAEDQPPESILATTFTRKAAGEILDRILQRLAEAAADADRARDLADATGLPHLSKDRCRRLLVNLVTQLHRLHVHTLDSFAIQIARSFSLELGLPLGWGILDEVSVSDLRIEAIHRVLARLSPQDAVTWMWLLDRGKARRGIGRQLLALIDEMYERVFLQATDEAWQRLQPRARLSDQQWGELLDELRGLETCPGLDNRMKTAWQKDVAAAEAEDWSTLLEKGLSGKIAAGETAYYRKPIPEAALDVYRRVVEHAAGVELNKIVDQNLATRRMLESFHAAYTEVKRETPGLTFADVTHRLGTALARRDPRLPGDRIAYRMDGAIRHLLLDEFQDTSPDQWRVLRPFAEHVCRARDGKHSFFCVGDAKQAIYAWRGGVAEIFDLIEQELDGLESASLATSYRSSSTVIETVNDVFEGIGDNPAFAAKAASSDPMDQAYTDAAEAWQRHFPRHSTARTELAGYCQLKTTAAREEGEQPLDATVKAAVAETIAVHRQAPGASIGVLLRKNDAIGPICEALRSEGLEASQEGGNPLSDAPAVQLVLSLLRLADHPGSTAAAFHVAHSELAELIGLDGYADRRAGQQAALRQAVSRRVRAQLTAEGYGPTLRSWIRHLASRVGPSDQARLKRLLERAYQYDEQSGNRADEFITVVESERVMDPSSSQIRVMTIHKAKGLQFDVVILPQLEWKLASPAQKMITARTGSLETIDVVTRYVEKCLQPFLPQAVREALRIERQGEVEQSLCLLYVAMTRAVHALHMLIPPSDKSPEEKGAKSQGQRRTSKRPKPKPPKQTAAGVLQGALAPGEFAAAEMLLYENGRRNWWSTLPKPEPQAPRPAAPPIALRRPTERVRELESVSPSSLEGGASVTLAEAVRGPYEPAVARGRLLHAWFEQITWMDESPPDDAALRRKALDHPIAGTEVDELLAEFHRALGHPVVRRVLSRSTYEKPAPDRPADERTAVDAGGNLRNPRWQVLPECPFAVRLDDTLCRGQIDRLVLLFEGDELVGADILDYKSDVFDTGDPKALAERTAFYQPQLETYRRAVSAWLGLPEEQITTRLLFIHGPALVRQIEPSNA